MKSKNKREKFLQELAQLCYVNKTCVIVEIYNQNKKLKGKTWVLVKDKDKAEIVNNFGFGK